MPVPYLTLRRKPQPLKPKQKQSTWPQRHRKLPVFLLVMLMLQRLQQTFLANPLLRLQCVHRATTLLSDAQKNSPPAWYMAGCSWHFLFTGDCETGSTPAP